MNENLQVTTDDVLRGIDLSGKVVLVTGGTTGLGKESARALGAAGAVFSVTVTPTLLVDSRPFTVCDA